ncbi:M1 family peptidase, partial [Lysinibacillus capsici]|uniref:M1 family aminopeptidase n=2 Tax=Lysinibacillus TaxID=400634 RepID=UPI001EB9B554
IIVDGMGMEYPGIVTVGSIYNTGPSNSQELKNMVIHEIAHQWFYGIVSNDPYSDAWLDEGFAVFAASLFKLSKLKETEDYNSMYRPDPNLELPVNLPLNQYESNMSSYVYGKSARKLWELFKDNGEVKEAEKFLKIYYHFYKYKEIDTKEFVRFVKYYFDLKDDTLFEGWLELEK